MSRFNSEAYDKLFPRVTETTPAPETVVETFRPSQNKPAEVEKTVEAPEQASADPEIKEEGGSDGAGNVSEPDPE